MALYLSEEDVKQIVTMPMALEAVEAAHRAHGQGEAIDVPRQRTRLPQSALHVLQGALPGAGLIGYKAYTTSRAGARFLIHLFDAADGNPVAVIAADYLGMMRTGAAGGVAAKWLARPDADVAGVFGAGWQAQSQIEALCAVRPIRRVRVYSRSREKLESFCEQQAQRLPCEVVPASSPQEAVAGSAVVVTITTAATPVFDGDWLDAGTHITAAGSNSLVRREIDEAAVRRAAVVCVDARATALKECGDLLPLLEKGRLHEGQMVELGEVIAGVRPGRGDARQITLFESHGMAIQDLALARRVLDQARNRGLGMELPY
jgi:ornithine cyclodeaminase